MRTMKIIIYRRCALHLYIAALCLSLIGLLPSCNSFAAENPTRKNVFSLKAANEPLDRVLEKVSKASGYKIIVKTELESEPISIQLTNVTLHEAIRRIFQKYSHVEIWDEPNKEVEIRILATKGSSGQGSGKGRAFSPGSESPPGEASGHAPSTLPAELSDHPPPEQLRELKRNKSAN